MKKLCKTSVVTDDVGVVVVDDGGVNFTSGSSSKRKSIYNLMNSWIKRSECPYQG